MKLIKIALSLVLLTLNTTVFAANSDISLDECTLIKYKLKDKEKLTGRTYYNLHTVKNIYVQGDNEIKINGEPVSVDPTKMKDVLDRYVECSEVD